MTILPPHLMPQTIRQLAGSICLSLGLLLAPDALAQQTSSSHAATPAGAPAANASPYANSASPYTQGGAPPPTFPGQPAAAGSQRGGARRSDKWEFIFSPNVWLAHMGGSVTVEGIKADLDSSFIDTLEDPDFGLSFQAEAHRGKLSFFLNYMSMDLSGNVDDGNIDLGPQYDSATDPLRARLTEGILDPATLALLANTNLNLVATGKVDVNLEMLEAAAGYRIWEKTQLKDEAELYSSFDLIGGIRYWRVETDVDVNLTASYVEEQIPPGLNSLRGVEVKDNYKVSHEESWVDPIIGGRYYTEVSKDVALTLGGDVGGFGSGSDFTWKASGILSHNPNDSFKVYGGYQALSVDYGGNKKDDEQDRNKDTFALDTVFHGPLVGFALVF